MVQPAIDPKMLRRFRATFHGSLIGPADAAYHSARRVWNGMMDRFPALIARCADAADVMAALQFAPSLVISD